MTSRERRLARLENGGAVPGRAVLEAELARLRAEVAAAYPGDPMTWPEALADDYLAEACGPGSDRFTRLAELERVLATPEQRAAEAAAKAQIASMSDAEIDAILVGTER